MLDSLLLLANGHNLLYTKVLYFHANDGGQSQVSCPLLYMYRVIQLIAHKMVLVLLPKIILLPQPGIKNIGEKIRQKFYYFDFSLLHVPIQCRSNFVLRLLLQSVAIEEGRRQKQRQRLSRRWGGDIYSVPCRASCFSADDL